MNPELIGQISGGIVILSIVPYAIRTWQRKIKPSLTSWVLWSFIGLALLLTYHGSGATTNVWTAVFGFTNPLGIAILLLARNRVWVKLTRIDVVCVVMCVLALIMWWAVRQNKEFVQYALYLTIIADLFAAAPTIMFVWTTPLGDRPTAWLLFVLAQGLNLFAITDHTFANYALPVCLMVIAGLICWPLVAHRLKYPVPLSDWI